MPITIKSKGPVFDSRIDTLIDQALDSAEQKLAKTALQRLRGMFRAHFRHPTGHYESQVHIEEFGMGYTVTDGGMVYGPWLEGVSLRNAETRFKGYSSFRKVRDTIDGDATVVTEHEVALRLGSA